MDNKDKVIELQEKLISDLIIEVTNVQNSLSGINDKIKDFNEKRFEVINVEVELPKELPLPVDDETPKSVPITDAEVAQINIDFPKVQLKSIDAEYYVLIYKGVKNQISKSESYETILRIINNL
jgi:hypothetical protein